MERTIPRYLWVYTSLKSRIENEEYPIGGYLPPEPELQRIFRVSRTTVRKAVEMLSQQGFVYTRQGRGTEILDYKATQKLGYVTSFSETLREQGFDVRYTDLKVCSVAAGGRVAAWLKLDLGSPLTRIDRITLANGTPIALMSNYLLPELAPGIEKRIGAMVSLYSFLESEYSLVIESAADFISARQATPEEAEQLKVPAGTPLLVVRRITQSGGRPIELALLHVVADRYEYCVYTRERPPKHWTARSIV